MTNALADAVARLGKSQEPPQRATAWTMTALNLLWRQAEDLPRGPAELTPLQRGVLEKLSEHDTPAPFHGFGLPARCWERRRWLGLVPATAFDMDVEDEDGQSRKVRELLARWNAGGPQRRKQAYEYLRERLTLQQFAEVLGEAAFGAGSLGSPPDDAYYACLDALSAKDADWAERYAVQLWGRLDCDTSVPERQRIVARSSLLVLKPIVAGLADDASLPDKWARLVRLGSHRGVELTRQLLDRLPPDQREQLFSSHLDDQEGWSVALLLLSPYLDFFPSIALIERFLELTSLAVKDEDRRRARTAVEALQGLAKSNHPLAGEVAQRLEAWRKARKTALKKMDL